MVGCVDFEVFMVYKGLFKVFIVSDCSGVYVYCGVCEYVMGVMVNGMVVYGGVILLVVIYLVFLDYEWLVMCMVVLMGLLVKFVFSYDLIGIGKNGLMYQFVEILVLLCVMFNMLVMCLVDVSEVVECWEVVMQYCSGLVSLVFV